MPSQIGRSINTIVREALGPALEAAGFRRQARNFRRPAGEAMHVVGVQGSKWNAGADGRFTINLGVYFPAAAALLDWPKGVTEAPDEAHCLVRQRIGHLMPVGQDYWWTINARTDLEQLGTDVLNAWQQYGAPWFDTVPDLLAAGLRLEGQGSYYLAAVAALANGDRTLAAARLREAIARFPDGTTARRWGVQHGLLQPA